MKFLKLSLLSFAIIVACNTNVAQASNYEKVLWINSHGHEPGDNEPSDTCYLTFNDDNMVVHCITIGDPETIYVYKITKKEKNKFCAKAVGEHWVNADAPHGLEKQDLVAEEVCGKFSGDRLVLKDWMTLKRFKIRTTDK